MTVRRPRRKASVPEAAPDIVRDEDEAGRQLSTLLISCTSDGRDKGLLAAFQALASFTLAYCRDDLSGESIDAALGLALRHSNRLASIVHAREPRLDGKPRLTPMGSRLKLVMRQADKIEEIIWNLDAAYETAAEKGLVLKRQNSFSKALTWARDADAVPTVKKILEVGEYRQPVQSVPATPEKLVERLSGIIEQLAKHGIDTEGLARYVIRHINPQLQREELEEDDAEAEVEPAFG